MRKQQDDGVLRRGQAYRLADWYGREMPPDVRAVWDGKPKRKPKNGEWYLSGAIIEAYLAPANLDTPFHIARLVRTRTQTTVTILGPYEPKG